MAGYDEQLKQNTIKYLYNLSATVPSRLTALKSLYTTRFRIGEERGNVFLATHKDRTKLSCTRCCLRLAEGPSKCVIRPEKKPSKFAKQVNSKTENGRALTKYQRLYFKKLNLNRNQLVTTCSFCQHQIPRLLTKPVKITPDVNMNESIPKKKKKKRKDKLCGLDQTVISLLTPVAKSAPATIDLVTPTPAVNTPRGKNSMKKTATNKNAKTPQKEEKTSQTKKTTPQSKGLKLGNNNKGQTPGTKQITPKSAAKKNKVKKENRKKLSNLVSKANNSTKNNLNNFLQFFH